MYRVQKQPAHAWQRARWVLVRDDHHVLELPPGADEHDAVTWCEAMNDAARLHNDRLAELDRQQGMRGE